MFYHFTISCAARQKTLSVKWHQSMSETRLYDKRYMSSRRMKEHSLRNRAMPLPKLSDTHEFISRQESMATATATTPLMTVNVNSHANEGNSADDVKCDCILPQDAITSFKYDLNSTVDIFNAKSESY